MTDHGGDREGKSMDDVELEQRSVGTGSSHTLSRAGSITKQMRQSYHGISRGLQKVKVGVLKALDVPGVAAVGDSSKSKENHSQRSPTPELLNCKITTPQSPGYQSSSLRNRTNFDGSITRAPPLPCSAVTPKGKGSSCLIPSSPPSPRFYIDSSPSPSPSPAAKVASHRFSTNSLRRTLERTKSTLSPASFSMRSVELQDSVERRPSSPILISGGHVPVLDLDLGQRSFSAMINIDSRFVLSDNVAADVTDTFVVGTPPRTPAPIDCNVPPTLIYDVASETSSDEATVPTEQIETEDVQRRSTSPWSETPLAVLSKNNFTEAVKIALDIAFVKDHEPSAATLAHLADELGLLTGQVHAWFKATRAAIVQGFLLDAASPGVGVDDNNEELCHEQLPRPNDPPFMNESVTSSELADPFKPAAATRSGDEQPAFPGFSQRASFQTKAQGLAGIPSGAQHDVEFELPELSRMDEAMRQAEMMPTQDVSEDVMQTRSVDGKMTSDTEAPSVTQVLSTPAQGAHHRKEGQSSTTNTNADPALSGNNMHGMSGVANTNLTQSDRPTEDSVLISRMYSLNLDGTAPEKLAPEHPLHPVRSSDQQARCLWLPFTVPSSFDNISDTQRHLDHRFCNGEMFCLDTGAYRWIQRAVCAQPESGTGDKATANKSFMLDRVDAAIVRLSYPHTEFGLMDFRFGDCRPDDSIPSMIPSLTETAGPCSDYGHDNRHGRMIKLPELEHRIFAKSIEGVDPEVVYVSVPNDVNRTGLLAVSPPSPNETSLAALTPTGTLIQAPQQGSHLRGGWTQAQLDNNDDLYEMSESEEASETNVRGFETQRAPHAGVDTTEPNLMQTASGAVPEEQSVSGENISAGPTIHAPAATHTETGAIQQGKAETESSSHSTPKRRKTKRTFDQLRRDEASQDERPSEF